jgi:hypothetical protein
MSVPDPVTKLISSKLPLQFPVKDSPLEDDDWQFYVEPIQAFRAWRVIDWDGALVLQSITYKVNWVPRQKMIAECRPGAKKEKKEIHVHAAPDLNHGCGIYSLKSLDDAVKWSNWPPKTDTMVYGRVKVWGHCLNFTKGYLSEFAYPSMLYVPPNEHEDCEKEIDADAREVAMILSDTYKVEAVTL